MREYISLAIASAIDKLIQFILCQCPPHRGDTAFWPFIAADTSDSTTDVKMCEMKSNQVIHYDTY